MIGLLIAFIVLMSAGVSLALVLAASGAFYIVFTTPVPGSIVAQRLFAGMDDFTLLAIPLFIFAGYLMNEAGLTARMLTLARLLMRKVYGGLAQIAVLVAMVFGGVSGAASADLAAVGITFIPEMERDGYKREFSTATITAATLMGAIIPPSIPFIIYGVQSQTSIGQLFAAGIVPGIGVGIVVMVMNHVLLKRQGFPAPTHTGSESLKGKALTTAIRDALIALFMPVIIIGGILGGVFTATESAAVAVLYALAVGVFVFHTINIPKLLTVIRSSVIMTAVVMIIVIASNVLNWALAFSQLPQRVSQLLLSVTHSPTVFLIIVLVLMLIIGMPLDPVPAIIIVTPVLLPAALSYGIDPVHFGVVIVLALTLGLATPPVGASLFVAMSISKVSMGRLAVAILPFLVALLVLTVIVTFVPQTYNWILPLLR